MQGSTGGTKKPLDGQSMHSQTAPSMHFWPRYNKCANSSAAIRQTWNGVDGLALKLAASAQVVYMCVCSKRAVKATAGSPLSGGLPAGPQQILSARADVHVGERMHCRYGDGAARQHHCSYHHMCTARVISCWRGFGSRGVGRPVVVLSSKLQTSINSCIKQNRARGRRAWHRNGFQ
jgi:hypothetical protein